MTKFTNIMKTFVNDEDGAFASEYAIFLVLIAATLVLSITWLGGVIDSAVSRVAEVIAGGVNGAGGNAPAAP
jgi:Flp pilus assembly pilin Flp